MAGNDDIVALPAIEIDDLDPTCQYIPLPGGWEVQTRGRGSSYRLLDRKTGERRAILTNDPGFIENFVTRMALEVHAATSTALAERDATIERLKAENEEQHRALALAGKTLATLDRTLAEMYSRATTAERERDEATAEAERLKAERDTMEEFIRVVASKKYDGEMYMSLPPKPVISYTAGRIIEKLDRDRAALTAKGGENAEG